MQLKSFIASSILFLISAGSAQAGPVAYGVCQTGEILNPVSTLGICADGSFLGCNAVAVACYAGAGFTFGTVTAGVGIPAAIVACNAALGTCSAACATVALFAPTP